MAQPKQARRATSRPESTKPKRPAIRTTIDVQGARVHNLKNISVELPRDQLTVVTGLSGSGKSSLAFDTIYAEGQRRYMESLSTYAKRFIAQVEKPDVDFVYGLSPVVSIEQKTIARNPRSTVATLTDVSSYLNLLVRHHRRSALPVYGRTDTGENGCPDPRIDPGAAGERGGRVAGAHLPGLRRGPPSSSSTRCANSAAATWKSARNASTSRKPSRRRCQATPS